MTMVNFNLDLAKHDNFAKAFTARQGDAGEQFQVTLFDNQVPYTPVNGDVVSLRVVTPTGKFASVAGTVNGNKVVFTLTGQVTSEAGYYKRAYIAVSNGSKLRTTQDLIFFSLGNSDINKGQADYYVAELDKLLQQLNEEFDEWLTDREADYSDLLARIVELTNRVTGLEQDIQDLIDAINNNKINTTNIFNVSDLNKPWVESVRNATKTGFTISSWAVEVLTNAVVKKRFEPNTTYTISYKVRVMTANRTTFSNSTSQGGLILYSGVTGYPTITMSQFPVGTFDNAKVGDVFEITKTFTTNGNVGLTAANYRVLGYAARGNEESTVIHDQLSFEDVQIQKGNLATGYQVSSEDTLRKIDERDYRPNVFPDPYMTGRVPFTTDSPAPFSASYSNGGYLTLNNIAASGRSRVFWSATTMGLGTPYDKQTYDVLVEARVSSGTANIEIGYSGQLNPIHTITAAQGWQLLESTIKSTANTALCIYINPGVNVDVRAVFLYPSATDVTSKRVEALEDLVNANLPQLNSVDFNSINYTSDLIIQGANAPLGDTTYYWYLSTYAYTADNCYQTATRRTGSNTTAYKFVRQKVNGNWLAWSEIPVIGLGTTMRDLSADSKNLDDVTYTSWGYGAFTSGAPTSQTVIVRTFAATASSIYQECYAITSGSNWQRFRRGGVWSPWITTTYGASQDLDRASSTVDMNTLLSNWEGIAINPSQPNAPASGNNTYYVIVRRYGGAYVMQTAVNATNGVEYKRFLVAGTWSEWRTTTDVKTDGTLYSRPAGSDLNTYTKTERFMISAPLNAPQSGQIVFYVDVEAYLTNYCKQTATAIGTADNTYTRQLTGANTWTPWKLITKV